MAKEVRHETETETGRIGTVNVNHNWLYGLVGVLLLLVVFMAGMGAANHHRMLNSGQGGEFGAGMARHQRDFMSFSGPQAESSGSREHGVVTAVNGNGFTLAGNGATTNVTTNSSTQYQGGNSVKQNDTVVVLGTSANNTLTATKIIINP